MARSHCQSGIFGFSLQVIFVLMPKGDKELNYRDTGCEEDFQTKVLRHAQSGVFREPRGGGGAAGPSWGREWELRPECGRPRLGAWWAVGGLGFLGVG